MEEILLFFALKYQGDFQSILKALQAKEKVSQEEESIFTELRKNLSQFDKRTVLIKYKEYSPELKSMIWKDKIQSVINISPNLEPDQVASLKKLLFLVNESFFTQSLVQLMSSNIEVASWIQNDSKLFSMDEVFQFLEQLKIILM